MKFTRYIFSAVLLSAVVAGCGNDEFDRPDYYDLTASTRMGQKLADGAGSYFGHIKSDVETRPTQGVSLLDMSYLNAKGAATRLFLYKASLGDITVRVTLPGDNPQLGNLATLTEQAASLEDKGVYTVWGAISGGAFDGAGQPTGILYHRGTALKETMASGSEGFFAILDDGQAVCLPAADYASVKHRIAEAVGGEKRLLEKGYVLSQSDTKLLARSAVGVTEDGGEVFLLTVDGGDFYYSNGIAYDDMAVLMQACGAYNAITLASENSVTAVWRNERLITLFDLLNKPAKKGIEIPIANGLAIVER